MSDPASTEAGAGSGDPLARAGALGIGAGRLLLGATIVCSTSRALAGLGFGDPSPATIALARLAGGRDIALGAHALLARGDPAALRHATALGALVDTGDALAFSAAIGAGGEARAIGLRNAPLGAAAAVAGAWVLRRMRATQA